MTVDEFLMPDAAGKAYGAYVTQAEALDEGDILPILKDHIRATMLHIRKVGARKRVEYLLNVPHPEQGYASAWKVTLQ